jgi:hypothetical protein
MDVGVGSPATYTECFQWMIAPTDLNDQNPDPSKAPHVINNSWGCPPSEGCTDPTILQAVVELITGPRVHSPDVGFVLLATALDLLASGACDLVCAAGVDEIGAIRAAVKGRLQAVGGLSIDQAARCPALGADLVVIGAPLAVADHELKPGADAGRLFEIIRDFVKRVKES